MERNIKDAAKVLNDNDMLVKIGHIEFHSKEVHYHNDCKRAYLNKARDTVAKVKPKDEDPNSVALKNLFMCIESSVIDNHRPEYLISLHRHYTSTLEKVLEGEKVCIPHKVSTLGEKIAGHFGNRVKLDCLSRKEGIVVYSSKADRELAHSMASRYSTSEEHIVTAAACALRSIVLEVCKHAPELPTSLSLDDFKKGQVEIPELLQSFFTTLFCGLQKNRAVSESVRRRVDSLSQDVIFCTSSGRVKPSKHLCLGVGTKSLTGSRRVVEVLNRFGHSIGYHTAESIETEIASKIVQGGNLLPDMLLPQPGLSTGLAWDNYDELTETLSGKDTLHDTAGICYQDISAIPPTTDPEPCVMKENVETSKTAAKRRRQFEPPERNIVPYKKRPSLSKFSYEVYSQIPPPSSDKAKQMNLIWLI